MRQSKCMLAWGCGLLDVLEVFPEVRCNSETVVLLVLPLLLLILSSKSSLRRQPYVNGMPTRDQMWTGLTHTCCRVGRIMKAPIMGKGSTIAQGRELRTMTRLAPQLPPWLVPFPVA